MRRVPLVPVRLLPFGVHPQVLLDVLLDGNPAVINVDGRAKDVDSLKHAAILLQNQAEPASPTKPFSVDHMLGQSFVSGGSRSLRSSV